MNAVTAAAPDTMSVWDALSKTDPAQTKGFKRSGGFSGTALKPMWVWKRLTEQFGPFGVGWGCNKPEFQLVSSETETLVYCTISAWHEKPENVLWGVGGDKAIAVNKYGPTADDEAFKKAFTDALMNAFKFVGVGADIHMGLFDDTKYVEKMRQEFGEADAPRIDEGQRNQLITLAEKSGTDMRAFCTFFRIEALPELPADQFQRAKAMMEKKLKDKAAKQEQAA